MTNIERLQGLWRRSLIAWPDGTRDTTTRVDWLQGPSLYVDLRQPAGQLQFDGVECLRDLAPEQAAVMAGQEGFAGTLVQHATHFEWMRLIDFQPTSLGDRGVLVERDGMLIEDGYGIAYREHWHRQPLTEISSAVSLRDDEMGCDAILARSGDYFMYARSRPVSIDVTRSLRDMVVDASSRTKAQDLVDCEISIGSIHNRWTISRSTLPWRVGTAIDPRRDGMTLVTEDIASDGRTLPRIWSVQTEQHDVLDPMSLLHLRALEA